MAIIDNLISAWLFENDATDSHGSNDGSPTGASYADGVVGNALVRDSSSDRFTIADNATLDFDAEDFSISVWINPDYLTGERVIVIKGGFSGQLDFELYQYSESIRFRFEVEDAGYQYANSGNVLTLGWQHIVATYKESTKALTIYRNGVSVATRTASYSNGSGSGTMQVGCWGSSYGFFGDIDELFIFGACLTADDVAALYSDGDGWAYPFYPKISAGTFESTGTLTGNGVIPSLKAGTFESTGTLSGSGKQADIGHFWVAVNHEDGGAYNPPGLAMITENGYKVKEISWADIDEDYDEYHSPNDFAVDNNGDIYVIGLDGATAVHKINSDGDVLWTFNVATGSATHVVVDPTGTYVYVANEYISARLIKLNAATGAEITDGDWPLTTDQIDVPDCHTLIYGRDGYIYMSDATIAAVLIRTTGIIQKIDPGDGSIEWNWRVHADYNRHLYCIAVNASGVVVAVHDAITTNQMVSILGSDGITDRTWQYDDDFQLDDPKTVVIDDSGYIYGVNGWSGLFKCISTQTWNPYGHEEWVLTGQHGFFAISPDDAYLYGPEKIQTSDGSVIWSMDTDLIELSTIKFSGAMLTRSAWIVTIDNGANGTITTNLGVEVTSGSFAVVDGGDLVLTVEPDAGYLVTSVEIDGVVQ